MHARHFAECLLLTMLLLLPGVASAIDLRGWFDDYGKTYEECRDVQQRILLQQTDMSELKAGQRATQICDTVWEALPEKLDSASLSEFTCTPSWAYLERHPDEAAKIAQEAATGWHTLRFGLDEARQKVSVVYIECTSSRSWDVRKATVQIRINNDAPLYYSFERGGGGFELGNKQTFGLAGDAGRPLSVSDNVTLEMVEIQVNANYERYKRK